MTDAPPLMGRTKRSNSGSFIDQHRLRSYVGPGSIPQAQDGESPDLFMPSTLSEHLLEKTYLDDVVKPLVRALVHARMAAGARDTGDEDHRSLYADLERLRYELQRSAQRRRTVERERDDLARRLDLVDAADPSPGGGQAHGLPAMAERPVPGLTSRYDRYRETSPAVGSSEAVGSHLRPILSGSANQPSPGLKPLRSHSDVGGESAMATGRSPRSAHADPAYSSGRASPSRSVFVSASSRSRSFIDGHPSEHREAYPSRGPGSVPGTSQRPHAPHHDHADPYGPRSGAYYDDRYGPQPSSSRTPSSRVPVGPPGLNSAPPGAPMPLHPAHRSAGLTLAPYASPRSSGMYSGTGPCDTPNHGDADHCLDGGAEAPRKYVKVHGPGDSPSASSRTPASAYAASGPPDSMNAPTRKLAATKNRTCSNCAAPHDAKFRRGPNGPGTLCDRCGSRWKKYKESEAAMRNHVARERANDASFAASPSNSGRTPDSRSPPPAVASGMGGAYGDDDADGSTSSRMANGRDFGGAAYVPPQHRQRLPPHLGASHNYIEDSSSNQKPQGGTQYHSADASGDGSESGTAPVNSSNRTDDASPGTRMASATATEHAHSSSEHSQAWRNSDYQAGSSRSTDSSLPLRNESNHREPSSSPDQLAE